MQRRKSKLVKFRKPSWIINMLGVPGVAIYIV